MKLGIVVPCYNEEEVLSETANRLLKLIFKLIEERKISKDSKIYFIDDGSSDKTWEIIRGISDNNDQVCGIKLSRNRGHQIALLAGLLTAKGDVLVSMDADLQDDISIVSDMISGFQDGSDIVYGVRRNRQTDTIFKRFSAKAFYKFMHLIGVDIVYNHADFRLMSRRAIESLARFKEVNIFIRGIVPLIGLKSSIVYYDRSKRFAGESKYPLKKMIAFAFEGITSFSVIPLRLVTLLGFIVFLFATLMSIWVVFIKLFTDRATPGWASIVLPIYFIGGIQLLSMGMIGEYLGKIYGEVKARPRYIIEEIYDSVPQRRVEE